MSLSKKRPAQISGTSEDKRQRLSGDTSESGETKQSEVSPESSAGETKEDGAADRKRQGIAKRAEGRSPPCIAVLYNFIKGKRINGKWVKGYFVPTGESITFTSRLKAGERLGGMKRSTITMNIDNKSRSKIKGGIHINKYVRLSNIIVEPIMFGGKEIKPAPAVSERVKGQKYVYNDIVRIWDGHSDWKCVHNIHPHRCVACGGAGICEHRLERHHCRFCCVQPLLECTECPHTCTSAVKLERHMCTHTDKKPFKCHHKRCSFRCARNDNLTRHEGQVHDIGNEQCTICWDDCYRPRSWIDAATKEEVKCCRTCYKKKTGKDLRVEQEWSDYLDEHFDKEFRLCSDNQVNSCNRSRPDGLWASNDLVLHWELDEHQHSGKSYSCEEKRILELYDQFPKSNTSWSVKPAWLHSPCR